MCKVLIVDLPAEVEHFMVTGFLNFWQFKSICDSFILLKMEASLMMVKSCTYLKVLKYVFKMQLEIMLI